MSDDLLLINRQAELPDLLREVLTGMAAELTDAIYEGRDVDPTPILTALGVGKPEQTIHTEEMKWLLEHAEYTARIRRYGDDESQRGIATHVLKLVDRIERAIGGGDG